MPWAGFESTIPEFERAKTVHDLERVSTVIGLCRDLSSELLWFVVKYFPYNDILRVCH
jgi:hypothetical protein